MHQLMTMTFQRGWLSYFRWPYHAMVMKMLEQMRRTMVHIVMLDALKTGGAVEFGVAHGIFCTRMQ